MVFSDINISITNISFCFKAMVTFNINNLSPNVPRGTYNNQTSLVTVQFLMNKANVTKLENKALHIRILWCTSGAATNRQANINWTSQNGAQRRRINQTVPYNRYFFCADVANPPHCFAIMTRTSSESTSLLRYAFGKQVVGMDFYMYEPNIVSQTLGETTPIIDHANKQLMPLVDHIVHTIPEAIDLNVQDLSVGQGGYFVFKGIHAQVTRFSLYFDCSCAGIMCDRQRSKGECTCIHLTSSKTFVYSFDVTFAIPLSLNGNDSMTVPGYKSLRTTQCFFKNYSSRDVAPVEEDGLKHKIRPKVATMTNYINQNGGWTVVGWFKKGEITDQATGQDKVANQEVTNHIIFMEPSDITLLSSDHYQSIMITETEPYEDPEEEPEEENEQQDHNDGQNNSNISGNDQSLTVGNSNRTNNQDTDNNNGARTTQNNSTASSSTSRNSSNNNSSVATATTSRTPTSTRKTNSRTVTPASAATTRNRQST